MPRKLVWHLQLVMEECQDKLFMNKLIQKKYIIHCKSQNFLKLRRKRTESWKQYLNNLASWNKYNFHGYIKLSYQIIWQALERKKHAYIKQEKSIDQWIWSIDQNLIHIEKS
jgi:hypothetical protein